jgi:hypothetical protein
MLVVCRRVCISHATTEIEEERLSVVILGPFPANLGEVEGLGSPKEPSHLACGNASL